jgi:hypothetical protein
MRGKEEEESVDIVPQQAMQNDAAINRPCTVALCVNLEEAVRGWNTTSPLVLNICSHNNSIATIY